MPESRGRRAVESAHRTATRIKPGSNTISSSPIDRAYARSPVLHSIFPVSHTGLPLFASIHFGHLCDRSQITHALSVRSWKRAFLSTAGSHNLWMKVGEKNI